MVNGVGSSSNLSGGHTSQSSTSLEAKLGQYKKNLADWVSCASSKTPEGKAKIKEFSDKVSETQKRLENIKVTKQIPPSTAPTANILASTKIDSPSIPAARDNVLGQSSSPPVSFSSMIGSRLDTFA